MKHFLGEKVEQSIFMEQISPYAPGALPLCASNISSYVLKHMDI